MFLKAGQYARICGANYAVIYCLLRDAFVDCCSFLNILLWKRTFRAVSYLLQTHEQHQSFLCSDSSLPIYRHLSPPYFCSRNSEFHFNTGDSHATSYTNFVFRPSQPLSKLLDDHKNRRSNIHRYKATHQVERISTKSLRISNEMVTTRRSNGFAELTLDVGLNDKGEEFENDTIHVQVPRKFGKMLPPAIPQARSTSISTPSSAGGMEDLTLSSPAACEILESDEPGTH